MKYIRTYESVSNKNELISEVSEILSELRDNGFVVDIDVNHRVEPSISSSVPPSHFVIFIKKPFTNYKNEEPITTLGAFKLSDIRDELERLYKMIDDRWGILTISSQTSNNSWGKYGIKDMDEYMWFINRDIDIVSLELEFIKLNNNL